MWAVHLGSPFFWVVKPSLSQLVQYAYVIQVADQFPEIYYICVVYMQIKAHDSPPNVKAWHKCYLPCCLKRHYSSAG